MRRRRRLIALAILWILALYVGRGAIGRIRRLWLSSRVQSLVEQKRWGEVLAVSSPLVRDGRVADDATRIALECRCQAHVAGGRPEHCVRDLEPYLLADPGGFVPSPSLAELVVTRWRDQGRAMEAARLVSLATRRHPHDLPLLRLELALRTEVEDEEAVLEEMEQRLPELGSARDEMRLRLADLHLRRRAPRAALRVLGEKAPKSLVADWHHNRARAYGELADLDAVTRCYQDSLGAGTDPALVNAQHAMVLSLNNLSDPVHPTIPMLRKAVEEVAGRIKDAGLQQALYLRLIATLVVAGRHDEALAHYERGRQLYPLLPFSPDDLRRSEAQLRAALRGEVSPEGSVTFKLGGGVGEGAMLVSPGPDFPVDTPHEAIPITNGTASVTRRLGSWPIRWVFRDGKGRVRGSGLVWPVANADVSVEVTPRAASPSPVHRPSRLASDGRRRLHVVILDCADWRFVTYGLARGELPMFAAALQSGGRAVLESVPPFTAIAMQTLVQPTRRDRGCFFFGFVHTLGMELAGLSFIGRNPLDGVSLVLPEDDDLFALVGRERLVAANMLFAHGNIDAGRNAEVTGPFGQRRRIQAWRHRRPLDADERTRFPLLARSRLGEQISELAAEMDAASDLARDRSYDLVALRVAAFDIMTHTMYADATRGGQDDGNRELFEVYRYVDARLAEVDGVLDEDDVLVIMSDHGIRTAMDHDKHCIFVAVGGGIPATRVEGSPPLSGLPRFLAALLGVATPWPETSLGALLPPFRGDEGHDRTE